MEEYQRVTVRYKDYQRSWLSLLPRGCVSLFVRAGADEKGNEKAELFLQGQHKKST